MVNEIPDNLARKLVAVKLVISDVDGTMARRIHLDYKGREIKVFCEKDAPRITAIIERGIPFVMISGRNSTAARARAKELKAGFYHRDEMFNSPFGGPLTAADPLKFVEKTYGVSRKEIMYIGDDWGDLWWMPHVLVTVAPADAVDEVRLTADIVTDANGGEGAVSDAIVYLLKAKGWYEEIVAEHYQLPQKKK